MSTEPVFSLGKENTNKTVMAIISLAGIITRILPDL
jgi:hypothetical protein